jgi:hypothetical protein
MSAKEKSDLPEVAEKRANKAASAAAELVERRGGAKENAELQSTVRTQSREAVSRAQARIREAVIRNKQDKLTALLHHINIDVLRASFFGLKKTAAPGVDEMLPGRRARRWTRDRDGRRDAAGRGISPLLANIYLHHVYDQWVHQWRQRCATGDVIVVRYADDAIVGFEHRHEAEEFLADLKARLARFGLNLHSDKTRLIEFGRQAIANRRARGLGKPETFDFLGFKHYLLRSCGVGWPTMLCR